MVVNQPRAAAVVNSDWVDTVSVEDHESFVSFDRRHAGGSAMVELDHQSE